MAGKGALAPTIPVYEGGGGVGGKIEKRLLRRSRATPYDRPHTALENSWVSKVFVDPAKKLIKASSARFFSSVFQKRLPSPSPTPLLPPPVANPELSNGLQDPVLQNKALQSSDAHSHYFTTEGSNVSTELLQLFKQNKFTRPEVDHLTKLLESKALNLPATDDAIRVESSLSKPTKQYLEDSSVENRRERHRSHAVLEEDIMFPAELAKEYTGSRFSKGTPSMSSFHNQVIIEDGDISNDVPSAPSSRGTSFATKIFNHGNDEENNLTTPRFRARSSLHKMASSRMHASPFSKGSGSIRKSTSPTLLKQDYKLGWKEPVNSRKRSSAVLDDVGSVDAIRRIRRKHGLTLPLGEKYGSGHVEPFSLTHKRSFMDDWRLKGPKPAGRVEDTNGTSTRFSHLPSKSSEPAARVLQNLENMVPEVNLVEAKLNAARQRTPFKLTEDMLCGKALKSIESIDSLNLLQGIQNGEKLEGNSRDLDFSSQNQNRAEENVPEKSYLKLNFISQKQNGAGESGPEKFHLQLDFTYPKQNGAEENGLGKDHLQHDFAYQKQNGAEETGPEESHLQLDTTLSVDSKHNLQSSIPSSTTSVAQKKHAFMMSVSEDFLDLDEDTYCNGPAEESLLKERGENKTLVAEGNPTPPGKLIFDKAPVLFETEKAHLELATVSDNSCVSFCGDGTTASTTFPLLVTPLQSGLRSPSPFSLEKSKDVESSSTSVLEVSHPWMCPEPVRPIRLGDAADLSLQVSKSGEREGNFSQEGANAESILPGSSNMHNDPVHSIPSTILPAPSLASTGFGNQASADTPSASGSAVPTLIATHTSATSSSLTLPALQPSVPLVSTFQFGSSDKSQDASFTKQEVGKEVNAISASMSPVGSTSVALTSTGSELLGLGSQPQNAGSGSMFGRQSTEVLSGAATASQSIPFQFGSSSSTSISTGTSGVSSNTASFSSSTPATNLFGSVPSFGLSSSTSSLETKSVTFDSGSSPSMFTFGSTVSAVSSSTSPAINAFTSSSSVTPGMFSFGAGTSSSNMSSSSSTIFGSTLQTPMSTPFSGTFNTSPSSGFTFGASSSFTAPNIPVMTFGASISSTPSIFTNPVAGNNDQMNGEDSMAEDPVQTGVPGFGQQPVSSSPAGGFQFGSTVQPVASPFQYNGQQSQVGLQNNGFQGSGSLEFNAGGSFSLGSVGGEDKSGRKYVKVNRNRHRKK